MIFDFHNHDKNKVGIYNLNILEIPPQKPFSIGIHPKDVDSYNDDIWNWFIENSQNPYCWTIGEAGLDGFVKIDESLQESIFEKQIIWANTIKKPITIHCIRRFSQLLKFKKIAKTPMIIHGFNKKKPIAEELLEKGFYLSFGAAALHNVSLQEIIKSFPLDRMFLESDNTEVNVELIYEKVSTLKHISLSTLDNQIMENLEKLRDI